jgi:hypothetical protein
MFSYYYNDNDDMVPLYREDSDGLVSIIKDEDPFNKEFREEEYNLDWSKEDERLNALNILQMSEYQTRQRKLMTYLEKNLESYSGINICVNRNREWCKIIVYRLTNPYNLWVVKNHNEKVERQEVECIDIPTQCCSDEFEICFKNMYTLCVEISHIKDHNGNDLLDSRIDDYPTITVLTPEKVIPLLLEFQSSGNFN